MVKKFKEYLGLPTIAIGGLDSYSPMVSLGKQDDRPPKGKGSRDSRAVGLVANYTTQGVGTMNPMLSTPTQPIKIKKEEVSLNDIKSAAKRFAKGIYDKLKLMATTSKRYEYAAKVLQDVIDRKKRERTKEGLPLRHDIGYYSAAVADTFKDIDPKRLVKMVHEANERVPRKPGQPAGSDKHSDLYTDENPKGTIHGLGFTDAETAKTSVNKIKSSGKTHAHKMQAAIAMSQRARVASQRAKDPKKKKDLGAAHRVYQTFIDINKKKD